MTTATGNALDNTPAARQSWILSYFEGLSAYGHVDVLNEQFVSDYVSRFKPAHGVTIFGAYKCRQLGRDLSAMYQAGLLDRSRIGLSATPAEGWPKWVYCYSLPDIGVSYACH